MKYDVTSHHGELFVAHDARDITLRTPSGFATAEITPSGFTSTCYPLDNGVNHHGELFVACDDRDITQHTPSGFTTTQLTPSGFAATCYPTLDTTKNATTSKIGRAHV